MRRTDFVPVFLGLAIFSLTALWSTESRAELIRPAATTASEIAKFIEKEALGTAKDMEDALLKLWKYLAEELWPELKREAVKEAPHVAHRYYEALLAILSHDHCASSKTPGQECKK